MKVSEKQIILNDESGIIELWPHYFEQLNSQILHSLGEMGLEEKSIRLFGREYLQPRLVAFMGEKDVHYTYSKTNLEAKPFHIYLEKIRDQICSNFEIKFNSVLLNYYRDGNDSMGLHSDDERELGINPTIASVSFGATRKMIFRNKSDARKLIIELKTGDLLFMKGALQSNWKHELPKVKDLEEPRLNLTFRSIK